MEKIKLCRGCQSKSQCFFNQNSIVEFDTENCPCQKCILKGVCVKICDAYDRYYDEQKRIFDKLARCSITMHSKLSQVSPMSKQINNCMS